MLKRIVRLPPIIRSFRTMLVSMDDQHAPRPNPELSIRSRASSIISTGTKMSIGTIQQEDQHPTGIDVLLGRRNFRINRRPGSILSISSFDQPAPPYEGPPEPSSSIATLTSVHVPNMSPLVAHPPTSHIADSEHDDRMEQSYSTSTFVQDSQTSSVHLGDTPNALFHHYTEIVRTIDANNQAEIARLISAQNEELNSLNSEHAAEIRRFSSSIAELERVNAIHVAELTRLKATHAAELDRLVGSITELERMNAAQAADLNGLKSTHAADLASVRNEIDKEYRKAFKVNRTQVEQIRRETASSMASFEKKCREEVAQATEREVRMADEVGQQRLRYISDAETKIERARNEIKEKYEQAMIETEEKCRKELKAKDLQIEHSHQQATSSITEMEQKLRGEISQAELRVQRARNEVEDVWEKRWKDRNQVSEEEMKRLEKYWRTELQKMSEAESREAEIWRAVRNTCPEKLEQLEKYLAESGS